MSDLRPHVVRLAEENPELRTHLVPLLREAAAKTLAAVAGSSPTTIHALVGQRTQVDWVVSPREWPAHGLRDDETTFRSLTLPRAKSQLKTLNEGILEQMKGMMARAREFERAALPRLKAAGFDVRFGKTELGNANPEHWVDYHFRQTIQVTDKMFRGNSATLQTVWSADGSGALTVSEETMGWSQYDSKSEGSAPFDMMVISWSQRLDRSLQRQWPKWYIWRSEQMAQQAGR